MEMFRQLGHATVGIKQLYGSTIRNAFTDHIQLLRPSKLTFHFKTYESFNQIKYL